MAKDANDKKPVAPAAGPVALPQACPVEACKSKPKRAGFCEEHFTWFKVGLISRKGEKPRDFDVKYQAFLRKKAA